MMTAEPKMMKMQGEDPPKAPPDTVWADGWALFAASEDPLAVDAWLEAPPTRSLRVLGPRPWPTVIFFAYFLPHLCGPLSLVAQTAAVSCGSMEPRWLAAASFRHPDLGQVPPPSHGQVEPAASYLNSYCRPRLQHFVESSEGRRNYFVGRPSV